MMAGIYKITSPTGKIYIGQTSKEFKERFKAYKTLNCKKQRKLYNSLVKYGPENHIFEIVEEFKDYIPLEALDPFELCIYIEYVTAGYEMLNLQEPGNGKHSKESKELMCISRQGNKNRLGKKNKFPLSKETRKKMSEAHKGKIQSEESRRKRSEKMKEIRRLKKW